MSTIDGHARHEEQWREEDSVEFSEYGDYFVPDRQQQLRLVTEIVTQYESPLVYDLCCGAGRISDAILSISESASVVAIDNSDHMLQRAELRLREYAPRVRLLKHDFQQFEGMPVQPPPDVVVASLAVHHLSDDRKRDFFFYVRETLRPKGCFILCDLFEPEDFKNKPLIARQWDAMVKQQSINEFGDDRAYRKFLELDWNHYTMETPDPIDQIAKLSDQQFWMKEAGFSSIEPLLINAGHAVIAARKG